MHGVPFPFSMVPYDPRLQMMPTMNEYDSAVMDIIRASMLDYIHHRIHACNSAESICMLFLEMRDICDYAEESSKMRNDIEEYMVSFREAYHQHRVTMSAWKAKYTRPSKEAKGAKADEGNYYQQQQQQQRQQPQQQQQRQQPQQQQQRNHEEYPNAATQLGYSRNDLVRGVNPNPVRNARQVSPVSVKSRMPRGVASIRKPPVINSQQLVTAFKGGRPDVYQFDRKGRGGGESKKSYKNTLRTVLTGFFHSHRDEVGGLAVDEDVGTSIVEAMDIIGSTVISGIQGALPAWPYITGIRSEWDMIKGTVKGSVHRRNAIIRMSMRIMMAGGMMACNLTSPLHGGLPCIPLSVAMTITHKFIDAKMEKGRKKLGLDDEPENGKSMLKASRIVQQNDRNENKQDDREKSPPIQMIEVLKGTIPANYTSPCDSTPEERKKYIILTLSHIVDVSVKAIIHILPKTSYTDLSDALQVNTNPNSNSNSNSNNNNGATDSGREDRRTGQAGTNSDIQFLIRRIRNTLMFDPEQEESTTMDYILSVDQKCGAQDDDTSDQDAENRGFCIIVRRDVSLGEIESVFDWIDIIIQSTSTADGSNRFTWGTKEDYSQLLTDLRTTYIKLAKKHARSDRPPLESIDEAKHLAMSDTRGNRIATRQRVSKSRFSPSRLLEKLSKSKSRNRIKE